MKEREVDSEAVARRLDFAMRRAGVGARDLSKRIRRKAGKAERGTSYRALDMYRRGEVASPRPHVLWAAADALGVRRDWLLYGEGAMTEEEQRADMARASVLAPDTSLRDDVQSFAAQLGAPLRMTDGVLLFDLAGEYARHINPDAPDYDAARAIVRDLLMRPLESLGIVPGDGFNSYVRSMILAMELALRAGTIAPGNSPLTVPEE